MTQQRRDSLGPHTPATPSTSTPPRRRALLQSAVAAVAAVGGAGLFAGGKSALAADLVVDASNSGTGTTRLTSATSTITFDARNTAGAGNGRTGPEDLWRPLPRTLRSLRA
jgi:hypothetical protein